jgi:DNA-binding MarR family transcriptional regulator
MREKDELTQNTIQRLVRVANLYARSESLPIRIDDATTITTSEAHMIQAIGDNPLTTVTETALRFGVSKSAASQLVEKLREKGYVEKSPSPHSNKEIQLSLTEAGWHGHHAHERFHGEDKDCLIRCLSAFPVQQIATLSVLLEAIGDILEERLKE